MTATAVLSHFTTWTENRSIRSLGTNDGATPIAFQTWHRFKEAFPPELIAKAVESGRLPVHSCLDPFGGSGTTALACQMLGIRSTTIEVNPFLADVIRAKLELYDTDELINALAKIRHLIRRSPKKPHEFFKHVPLTFLEPGLDDRWIFNTAIAQRLATLLSAIQHIGNPNIERLFRVLVGGILAEVSNVTVSGKGRRYRRNWKSSQSDPKIVDRLFAVRAETAIKDIQRFSRRPRVPATVIQGDSRSVKVRGNFDLSVFSPPYPNSFDYTDVYNLELWMLGYLSESEDNRVLRTSTLSSHVQLMREYAPAPSDSQTLTHVLERLREVKPTLWNPWIPSMIGAYFADLAAVLKATLAHLTPGAECWMVVGDSRYADVAVPVAKILCELSESRGWIIDRCESIRHMRSSVQQGWKPELAESLLVLTATGATLGLPSL